jgi:hypothetical protein
MSNVVPQLEFDDRDDAEDEEAVNDLLDFSVSDINIKTEQQSGHHIIDMLRHNEINMDTPFQRSPDLWKAETMSRFIESMMLKFPIPPFYFDISYKPGTDDQTPYWQVVDGLQRLSAIRRFVVGDKNGNKLKLKGLDFFKSLNGETFDSLPRHLARNIEACQVTLFLIYPNTPKHVKHRIFERVNTGGLKLNAQEIRHALNVGRPTEILKKSVEEGLVKNGIKIDPGRMKDQELALRYLAFQLITPQQYEDSMKLFLDMAMEALEEIKTAREKKLIRDFGRTVRFLSQALDGLVFRKEVGTAINRSLFDSYTYAASQLDSEEMSLVLEKKATLQTIYRKSLEDRVSNRKFLESISTATARKENIVIRFSKAKSILEEVLNA